MKRRRPCYGSVPSDHAASRTVDDTVLSAGIDIGTSGVRAVVLDTVARRIVALAARPVAEGERTPDGGHLIDDGAMIDTALRALGEVAAAVEQVDAVSVAGAAGTLCFRDRSGAACAPAVAYDDSRFGSGLERVVAWRGRMPQAVRVVPITDAVLEALGAEPGCTDWTNALKLGWDPRSLRWSGDAATLERDGFLPRVAPPGARAARDTAEPAAHASLGRRSVLARGATDSCAMHVAAAGLTPGAWSVSLGSTVTWKAALAGTSPPAGLDGVPGAYAHRLAQDVWLAAAASNCGGAVLTALEPGADLAALDAAAHPPSGFAAYPLARPGERFPVSDPAFAGFGVPHPSDPRRHAALLEGIAFVIRRGIERLGDAGVATPEALHLSGGGSRSDLWTAVIGAVLERPLIAAPHADPALGAALLAAAAADNAPLGATAEAMRPALPAPKPLADSHLSAQMHSAYQRFVELLVATAS